MVVIGGGGFSYERGTPVFQASPGKESAICPAVTSAFVLKMRLSLSGERDMFDAQQVAGSR